MRLVPAAEDAARPGIARLGATSRAKHLLSGSLPWYVPYAVGAAVVLRLVLAAVGAWLLAWRPIQMTPVVRAQYLGQTPLHDLLLAPWQRFDALWYVRIALHGYAAGDGSTAYYPLYPLVMRLVMPLVGGDALAAGLLVSTASLAGLLAALYALVSARHGRAAARRSVLLLCLFPTAVFLVGVYTESLFLLLVVGAFLALEQNSPERPAPEHNPLERRRWLLAGLLAALAALTRAQGLVLVLPLCWFAAAQWRQGKRSIVPWLAAALPAVATLCFLWYTRAVVRAGFITSTFAQHWHMGVNPPWVTLAGFVSGMSAHGWRLFSYPTGNWVDAMNLLLALAMLGLVLPSRRLLGTPLWLYAIGTWLVVLSLHQSTARYMLTLFPALVVLAVRARGRLWPKLALLCGAPTMIFVAAEFFRWSFVG